MAPKQRIDSEDELIAWLRRRTANRGGRLIGNDAAVLPYGRPWAVTMDTQIEGVHFLPGLDPTLLARRLLAVNLSDLAAMGARPAYAFLALSAPADFDHQRFFEALIVACELHDLELAGGDLSSQEKTICVLTLLGKKPNTHRWLCRDVAQAGDGLWLGGSIGEAATGLLLLRAGATWEAETVSIPERLHVAPDLLEVAENAVHRHLLPTAQIELGSWLARQERAAAIDVSDGLARDLSRLCTESGVGAEIEIDRLPLPAGLESLIAVLGGDWKSIALGGGEDYVLLFTLPTTIEPPKELRCSRIGTITGGDGVVVSECGSKKPLETLGWDHFTTGC